MVHSLRCPVRDGGIGMVTEIWEEGGHLSSTWETERECCATLCSFKVPFIQSRSGPSEGQACKSAWAVLSKSSLEEPAQTYTELWFLDDAHTHMYTYTHLGAFEERFEN